ncbi:MAG TPA: NrsF family protein [Steroidobacteraceae bacterium]|nr:NrsF family protein [Steroidobacteraceae bacterium]
MDTEQLIESLSEELTPVRPLLPPSLRAAAWLGATALLVALGVGFTVGLHIFSERIALPRVACQCVGEALTAVSAVLAAFMRSVPGRSPRWALLPLPGCVLWLAASGLGCLANGWSLHGAGGFVGESAHCFAFILGASVPLAAALFLVLRRARPIDPLPVASLGMLGVAATAAFVLEFFHPFDVTVIDLTLHLAAVGIVIALGIGLRRRALAAA